MLDGASVDPSEEGRLAVEPARGAGPPADLAARSVGRRRGGAGLDASGRLRTGRLAGLSMGGAIWVLSWPILVESVLNSFVGLTDTVLAAQLSEAATDAIGAAAYFQWFISLIAMALATGATALVSRSVGKGRLAVAKAAVGQTIVLALAAGTVVGSGMYAGAGFIADLINLPDEAAGLFETFMRIVSVSVPAGSVLFAGIACLRGAGDSLTPLIAMACVNVVNIVTSFILAGVAVGYTQLQDGELVRHVLLEPVLEDGYGVLGIAAGTVAAHAVGALLIVSFLVRGTQGVRLAGRWLKPHWVTMGRLVRLGIPNFGESLGMWLGNFLVVMMVGWLTLARQATEGAGEGGLFGAHILAIRIEAFSFLPGFSMGMAAATLAGQYLGAGSVAHARRAILWCTAAGAGMMTLMGVAFFTIPEQIVGLMSAEPSHLEMTPPILAICGYVQLFFGIALVIRSSLRGAGDVHAAMWITWVTTYVIRLPAAYLLSGVDIRFGETVLENPMPDDFPVSGLTGLWLGLCGELVIRGFFFAARFLQGGWARAKV